MDPKKTKSEGCYGQETLSSPPQIDRCKQDEVEDKTLEDAVVFVVGDASALDDAASTEVCGRRTGRETDVDTDRWDSEED